VFLTQRRAIRIGHEPSQNQLHEIQKTISRNRAGQPPREQDHPLDQRQNSRPDGHTAPIIVDPIRAFELLKYLSILLKTYDEQF
jgi:hypothetical protein